MEEFFKQPMLERLYESLCAEFEEKVLKDKNEYKKYHGIIDKEEKLCKMLKEIIGNDNDKLKELMKAVIEMEDSCLEEIDFWNRKYFKLGFTYMVALGNPRDFIKSDKDTFSLKIHSFLDTIRIKKIAKSNKVILTSFIENLEKATEKQKRRFLMYYNLMPNSDKVLSYTDIARLEGCSISAIKNSILAIILQLIKLEDSQKELLLIIMNKINI